jgi:spore protease
MRVARLGADPGPWTVRTDLAVEARAQMGRAPLAGVRVDEREVGDVHVERVQVETEAASERLGKPKGSYVTLQSAGLRQRSRSHGQQVAAVLAAELSAMLDLGADTSVLLVGLGNWNATPDALGPRVVGRVLVTRHLADAVPSELAGNLRPVCALSPGVLGLTGIETGEVVRGVVRETRPDRVVCVDALAAQDPDRLATTIQLADTGIRPGSGVGSHRVALTEQTLGVPTLAIGVPTVVHAIAIVEKSLSGIASVFGKRWGGLAQALLAEEDANRDLLRQVLSPSLGRLMVTPKEVDVLIDEMAWIIAGSLNAVLHPGIDLSDFAEYAR